MSAQGSGLIASHGSFLGKLRAAHEALERSQAEDPWVPILRNLKGASGLTALSAFRPTTCSTCWKSCAPPRQPYRAAISGDARLGLEQHPSARAQLALVS